MNHLPITAVILAGGLGTRLRSEISDRPKALATVAGQPFLEHIFDQLSAFGITQVVLCTGYMAEQIESLYGTQYKGLSLSYSRETVLLGTGGAVRFALPLVSTPLALILNGDSFCEFDLSALTHFHREHHAQVSMVLTHVDDCSRFGSVVTQEDGKVTSFIEKSAAGGPGSINAGVYLVARELLAEIPPGRILSLEKDIFPNWIDQGFFGFCSDTSLFIDIGTPQSFRSAQSLFAERSPNG
jgi:D-glycero-alpha-D-manno-heptose 1-phosphate guanylyltransferase